MSLRSLRALVALSLLPLAGAAGAAPSSVPLPPAPAGTALVRPPGRTFLAGARVGLDTRLGNGGDGAAVFEVDVVTPWRTTASGVALAWALELRSFLPSKTDAEGLGFGSTGLELTPTLRASVPIGASRVALRTQLGLGAVTRWTWKQVDTRFVGRETVTGSETTGLVRAGLALDWTVRPRLTVALEPLSLGFDLRGNADWILAAGATYRL